MDENLTITDQLSVLSEIDSINESTGSLVTNGGMGIKVKCKWKYEYIKWSINSKNWWNIWFSKNRNRNRKSRTTLDIIGTDGIILPQGGSDDDGRQNINGMIRFNTDTKLFEGYTGVGDWGVVGV